MSVTHWICSNNCYGTEKCSSPLFLNTETLLNKAIDIKQLPDVHRETTAEVGTACRSHVYTLIHALLLHSRGNYTICLNSTGVTFSLRLAVNVFLLVKTASKCRFLLSRSFHFATSKLCAGVEPALWIQLSWDRPPLQGDTPCTAVVPSTSLIAGGILAAGKVLSLSEIYVIHILNAYREKIWSLAPACLLL